MHAKDLEFLPVAFEPVIRLSRITVRTAHGGHGHCKQKIKQYQSVGKRSRFLSPGIMSDKEPEFNANSGSVMISSSCVAWVHGA